MQHAFIHTAMKKNKSKTIRLLIIICSYVFSFAIGIYCYYQHRVYSLKTQGSSVHNISAQGNNSIDQQIADSCNQINTLEEKIEKLDKELADKYKRQQCYSPIEHGRQIANLQSSFSDPTNTTLSFHEMDVWIPSNQIYSWNYLTQRTTYNESIPCLWSCYTEDSSPIAITTGTYISEADTFSDYHTYLIDRSTNSDNLLAKINSQFGYDFSTTHPYTTTETIVSSATQTPQVSITNQNTNTTTNYEPEYVPSYDPIPASSSEPTSEPAPEPSPEPPVDSTPNTGSEDNHNSDEELPVLYPDEPFEW